MSHIDVLKALADENRLAILCFLQSGQKCVCEVEQVLAISQSATSKHLARLRLAGLIEAEKKAQWVHYSLSPVLFEQYPFVRELLAEVSPHHVFDTSKIKKMNCDN
ncbi:ArsR/SmtB family transcription factor [Propionispora hippei]|uniref:ArsR family transcriptional regulator n=1 Tax=Propionispora hippei DSM 15287 TaxID=1123003 RepID=A0A1M6KRT3_9FIRM|nr:metalloregulator ArsR/SmtB family transcription factor [Propionispora hippei]SHJ61606.1 ArsR family transcriptional regulator [Propionispora hippei DSM 15287]